MPTVATKRGDGMSRRAQYRERWERKRNAFLLLTLSGAIRSADVDLPCCFPERMTAEPQTGSTTDQVPERERSIWAMNFRQFLEYSLTRGFRPCRHDPFQSQC